MLIGTQKMAGGKGGLVKNSGMRFVFSIPMSLLNHSAQASHFAHCLSTEQDLQPNMLSMYAVNRFTR